MNTPRTYILRPGGTPKPVKNLAWLLRNWREVESFRFYYAPDGRCNDGVLSARMRDGRFYRTDFASLTVCFRFLRRSVFDGLKLTVLRGEFASPVIHNYPEKIHEIGSVDYCTILAIENRRAACLERDQPAVNRALYAETLERILP